MSDGPGGPEITVRNGWHAILSRQNYNTTTEKEQQCFDFYRSLYYISSESVKNSEKACAQ